MTRNRHQLFLCSDSCARSSLTNDSARIPGGLRLPSHVRLSLACCRQAGLSPFRSLDRACRPCFLISFASSKLLLQQRPAGVSTSSSHGLHHLTPPNRKGGWEWSSQFCDQEGDGLVLIMEENNETKERKRNHHTPPTKSSHCE